MLKNEEKKGEDSVEPTTNKSNSMLAKGPPKIATNKLKDYE